MAFAKPSPNFHILFESDHQARAQSFAVAQCQEIDQPVRVLPGLDTLVFWGHGTQATLCKKSADQIAAVVKAWKASNSKIGTIEIITCNSRHAVQGKDPYVRLLRSALGFRLRSLKIKSVPIRMGPAGIHGSSILFADAPSKTWCYMTNPSESSLGGMRKLFNRICEKDHGDNAVTTATYFSVPPAKKPGEEPPVNPFPKYVKTIPDIHDSATIMTWLAAESHAPTEVLVSALKDDAFRREFIRTRKYSMNYGTFDTLRDLLVTIS